jgi:hypothetical protein
MIEEVEVREDPVEALIARGKRAEELASKIRDCDEIIAEGRASMDVAKSPAWATISKMRAMVSEAFAAERQRCVDELRQLVGSG